MENTPIIRIKVYIRKIVLVLACVIVLLLFFSLVSQFIRFNYLDPITVKFDRFNLDAEGNIPNYFSTIFLLFIAILLGFITTFKMREKNSFATHWLILTTIFLLMSMDEAASIHDMISSPLKNILHTTGIFYFAWVIPAIIFVIIFFLNYFRFWLNLPNKSLLLFAVSAFIYIGGAIGFELISGKQKSIDTNINFTYVILTNIEEFLELIGIVLFIYTLLDYIKSNISETKFHLSIK